MNTESELRPFETTEIPEPDWKMLYYGLALRMESMMRLASIMAWVDLQELLDESVRRNRQRQEMLESGPYFISEQAAPPQRKL